MRKSKKRQPRRRATRKPPSLADRVYQLELRVHELETGSVTTESPLDPESARVAAQHRDTMARKARGETGVKWNADDRIRYRECLMLNPNARVGFKQIMPVDDDGMPSVPVAALPDYDALVKHLRETHWRGERATYKWFVFDSTQPQWATGTVQFAESRPPLPVLPPGGWPAGYPAPPAPLKPPSGNKH